MGRIVLVQVRRRPINTRVRGGVLPKSAFLLLNKIDLFSTMGAWNANRSGFSVALGVIFSIDKGTGIQMGILVGQDRLGNSATAPYVYEGKTWLSMSVGFKFN